MHDSGNVVLRTLFILVWAIAIMHIAAEMNFWYWTYRWLDIPMHILGGVWLGLAVLWLRNHTHRLAVLWTYIPKKDVVTALVGGISIGVVWELYEYAIWRSTGFGFPSNYVGDTQLDLVMDTIGALLGYALYRAIRRRHATVPQGKNSPA